MNFNKAQLQQGRMNAQAASETPGTFGETNSSDIVHGTHDLTKSPMRMAGQMGVRALQLMEDPEESKRTATWMQQFGLSNAGREWNGDTMNGEPVQEEPPQE